MMAESFDCVTIFYGEIVAFDKLISDCKADEVGGRKSDKVAKKRWVAEQDGWSFLGEACLPKIGGIF